MLKFQLHSDLINPWPNKFVQKLEIKDSVKVLGKKRSNAPKKNNKNRVFLNTPHGKPAAHGLIRWLVTVKSFPFFRQRIHRTRTTKVRRSWDFRGERWGGQVTGGWSVDSQKNSEGVQRCSVLDAVDLLLPNLLTVIYVTRPMKPQKIWFPSLEYQH